MKKLLIQLCCLLLASGAYAAPNISSVPVLNESTIQISGSGFDSKSPAAPYRHDFFEDGTPGTRLVDESEGGWYTFSYDNKKFAEYNSVNRTGKSGGQSALQDFTYDGNGSCYIGLKQFSTTELYVFGWFNFTATYTDGGTPSRNAKVMTMYNTDRWQTRIDLYPSQTGGHHMYMYKDMASTSTSGAEQNYNTKPWNTLMPDGQWHTIESYLDTDTPDDSALRTIVIDGEEVTRIDDFYLLNKRTFNEVQIGHYYATGYAPTTTDAGTSYCFDNRTVGAVSQYHTGDNDYWYNVCQSTGYWGGKSRTVPPVPAAMRYWDEIYVDTTPQRVMICNNQDGTGICEIQTPTTWSTSSITVAANYGNLQRGGQAYLVVYDADNVISNGREITVPADGPDTTPPFLLTSTPVDNQTGVELNNTVSLVFDGPVDLTTLDATISPGGQSNDQTTGTGSSATISPSGQNSNTVYTVTIAAGLEDTSGNAMVSPTSFSYTTIAPLAECDSDNLELCYSLDTCNDATGNWCADEMPACKAAACTNDCSPEFYYLCYTKDMADAEGVDYWEGAGRSGPQNANVIGHNLLINPMVTEWSGGVPIGWGSYDAANIEPHSLGVKMWDNGHIHQGSLEAGKEYFWAYNAISTTLQTEFWRWDNRQFTGQLGTISGTFIFPEGAGDDEGYFKFPEGSTGVMNGFVIKEMSSSKRTISTSDGVLINTVASPITWNTQ